MSKISFHPFQNLFILKLGLIFSFTAFLSIANAAEDSDYVQVARDRQYVGGQEESDLKVQVKLLTVELNSESHAESEEGF